MDSHRCFGTGLVVLPVLESRDSSAWSPPPYVEQSPSFELQRCRGCSRAGAAPVIVIGDSQTRGFRLVRSGSPDAERAAEPELWITTVYWWFSSPWESRFAWAGRPCWPTPPRAGSTPRPSLIEECLCASRFCPSKALTDRDRSFGMLSSFPPTACGLATFTAALAAGLARERHPGRRRAGRGRRRAAVAERPWSSASW